MRTIISFGIATILVLVAVGTWATTTQVQPQLSGAKVDPLELMMNVKDLPIQRFDAI
jgi:hypothetical protein